MKNTILKSYIKKILKSEAFVSVIIVFVLALGIIGSSYALYMDIDTDTDYQLVKVGDLAVGFGDNGSNLIQLDNMTPTTDEIAISQTNNISSFYIYNTGTYTANYKIKLVAADGNQVDTKFINYQICRDNSDNCKDIKTLNESGETLIYTDELSPNSNSMDSNSTNPSAYYFVRLWINDKYTGAIENKTIILKIIIEATNASGYLDNDNTLAGAILNNPNITINNSEPKFDDIADYKIKGDSTSGELGLFKAEDDYGISYYFRGAQSNNYVNFAGFTWRIVRINGDGSIRLILNNSLDIVKRDGVTAGNMEVYNNLFSDNAYVGYMYGLASTTTDINRCLMLVDGIVTDKISQYGLQSDCENNGGKWTTTAYEATHVNILDSVVKDNIDLFYEKYLENASKNYHYSDYLADTEFCGDKSIASDEISDEKATQLGYGGNLTYYAATERLYNSNSLAKPTLKCAETESNDFSRFTVKKQHLSGAKYTNGDLKYPIALISADELVMAGAFENKKNDSFYISEISNKLLGDENTETGDYYIWTMTPYYKGSGSNFPYLFSSYLNEKSLSHDEVTLENGIRPVINLKADVLVAGGNGTSDSPYTVKLY